MAEEPYPVGYIEYFVKFLILSYYTPMSADEGKCFGTSSGESIV